MKESTKKNDILKKIQSQEKPSKLKESEKEIAKPKKRFPPVLLLFMSLIFIPFFNLFSYFPALPNIHEYFATSWSIVMLTTSLYQIVVGFSPLIIGPSSDLFGRRNLVIVCSFFYAILSLTCFFAKSIKLFLIARTAQGFFTVGQISIFYTSIYEILPLEKVGIGLSALSFSITFAILISPTIGGIIVNRYEWRGLFAVYTLLGCYSFFSSLLFYKETVQKKKTQLRKLVKSWVDPLRYYFKKDLILIFLIDGIFYGLYNFQIVMIPLIINKYYHYNETIIGLSLMPSGFGGLIGAIFCGPLIDYFYKKYNNVGSRMIIGFISLVGFGIAFFFFGYTLLKSFIGILVCGFFLNLFITTEINSTISAIFDLYPTKTSSVYAITLLTQSAFSMITSQISVFAVESPFKWFLIGSIFQLFIISPTWFMILKKNWTIKRVDQKHQDEMEFLNLTNIDEGITKDNCK
ncbi:polyamine transporter 2-related [Anaeramoeba flamelloides]|uniref:Polyamine transporter 2-related n=1 Tax=Anaeramoeba flamelloides TaxID=1746091 RepID=A0ABQ8YF93_9EUKA|nr:polyamine transporter 2-related [Anaeramoeba flamelloides]